jgi:hypothetical protein
MGTSKRAPARKSRMMQTEKISGSRTSFGDQ